MEGPRIGASRLSGSQGSEAVSLVPAIANAITRDIYILEIEEYVDELPIRSSISST